MFDERLHFYDLYLLQIFLFGRRRINTCVMAKILSKKNCKNGFKTGNYIGGMTYKHPLVIRTETSNKV